MSYNPRPKEHPVSLALRAEGFIPLPRLWVKSEDMPAILQMAHKHKERVTQVRSEVHAKNPWLEEQSPSPVAKRELVEAKFYKSESAAQEVINTAQAIADKEAAWEAFERERDRNRY